jgi:hypothetical protein
MPGWDGGFQPPPDRVVRPAEVEGQRASTLRFGDKRVQAMFAVLVVFSLQLRGFNNSEMRALLRKCRVSIQPIIPSAE